MAEPSPPDLYHKCKPLEFEVTELYTYRKKLHVPQTLASYSVEDGVPDLPYLFM